MSKVIEFLRQFDKDDPAFLLGALGAVVLVAVVFWRRG